MSQWRPCATAGCHLPEGLGHAGEHCTNRLPCKTHTGWELQCKFDGTRWERTETMATLQEHFLKEHDTARPQFDLVWTGPGPSPDPRGQVIQA